MKPKSNHLLLPLTSLPIPGIRTKANKMADKKIKAAHSPYKKKLE